MSQEAPLNQRRFSVILIAGSRFFFTKRALLVVLLLTAIVTFPITKVLGNTLSQPSPTDITSIAWRADGNLFAASTRSEVWLYTADGAPVTELMIDPGSEPESLSWHPSEHKLAVAAFSLTSDARIYVWSVTGNPPNLTIVADEPIQAEPFGEGAISWSPDTRLAFTHGSFEINIWDTTTGDLIHKISPEGDAFISGIDWSPDGLRLVASIMDEARVFEMTNYQEVGALESQSDEGAPSTLVWSPTGNQLAVGEGSTIVIWEYDTSTDSFQVMTTLTQSPDYVFWLDWQADRLVATCNDYIIRVWDTTTWEVIDTFPSSTVPKSAYALALSPDGSQVAYANEDGVPAIEFSNPINAYPFFEDFENGTDKWALSEYWDAENSQFYSGTRSIHNARGTNYTAYTDTLTLIDPLDLSSADAPYLTYESQYKLSANERVQVQVSTDDGASWTTVETYFEITDLDWKPRRIDLRAYQGQSIRLRFAFVATACATGCADDSEWWIDDIKVYEVPSDALVEDFEAGISQWTTTNHWAHSSEQQHGGGSWAVGNKRETYTTAYTGTLTLNDQLDLGEFSAPLLTYWSKYSLTSHETIRVQAYIVGSGPWTTIQTISNLNNGAWMRQRVDLSPYRGQSIRLRFVFAATACASGCEGSYWWVDDISVIEQPAMTFADDFELGVTNWTLTDRWVHSTAYHSGSQSVRNRRDTYYDAYTGLLILNRSLDLTTSDIPILTFWTRYRLSGFESIQVQVRPTGTSSWTNLLNMANLSSSAWPTWWLRQLDLTSYAGQSIDLRFRFYATACTANCVANRDWTVDDVHIAELPPPSGDLPFVDGFQASSYWDSSEGWAFGIDSSDPNNEYAVGMVRTLTYGDPEDLLLTQSLDLAGIWQPKLQFRTKYKFSDFPATGNIQVSVDGGTTWDTLKTMPLATVTSWEPDEVDLSAYAGRTIQLRFRINSTQPIARQNIWHIDDVVIQETRIE